MPVDDHAAAAAMPGSSASSAARLGHASQGGEGARAHEGHVGLARSDRAARPGEGMGAALRPLLIDAGVPLGTYYLLHAAFGLSVWLALALSSIGPAARTVAGAAAGRRLNLLAALMLAVNLAGIAVSFLTGDPRAMIAKDSLVSSVIAVVILASVAMRRPLMSAGLKPFMTKGTPERTAAWDRLSAGNARFRRLELLFSAIWGCALLADCAARLVGAYTLPVATMAWLSTLMVLAAVGVGIVAGSVAAVPIQKMIDAAAAVSLPARTAAERPAGGDTCRPTGDRVRAVLHRTWITRGEPGRLSIAAERAAAAAWSAVRPVPLRAVGRAACAAVRGLRRPGRVPAALRRPGGASHRGRAGPVRRRLSTRRELPVSAAALTWTFDARGCVILTAR